MKVPLGVARDWRIVVRNAATKALFDPQKLIAVVRRPTSGEVVYVYGTNAELERVSAGVYRIVLHHDEVGTWTRRYQVLDVNDNPIESVETNYLVVPSEASQPLG